MFARARTGAVPKDGLVVPFRAAPRTRVGAHLLRLERILRMRWRRPCRGCFGCWRLTAA